MQSSLSSQLDEALMKNGIGGAICIEERQAIVFYTSQENAMRLFHFLDKAEETLGWSPPLLFSYAQVPFHERLRGREIFHVYSNKNAALMLARFPEIVSAMARKA
jgi:hypothetical protein